MRLSPCSTPAPRSAGFVPRINLRFDPHMITVLLIYGGDLRLEKNIVSLSPSFFAIDFDGKEGLLFTEGMICKQVIPRCHELPK